MSLDPATFPRLRTKRIGGELLTVGTQAPLPRSRVFSWAMTQTANTRRTVSGPRCQGPALLKDFSWYISAHAATVNVTFEIGYAKVSVTEAAVALATIRPYTVLTEIIDPSALVAGGAGQGLIDASTPGTAVRWKEPLDLIVDEPEFFPVVACCNVTATTQLAHGQLRVVEGILRSALEQYF